VLAKHKGVAARRGPKEAWSKAATRRTETVYEAAPAGRAVNYPRSPYPSKTGDCRCGGCAVKAVELTSGGLRRCPTNGTGEAGRRPDRGAEVSRGHSRPCSRRCS
jgi:hypothetical protein